MRMFLLGRRVGKRMCARARKMACGQSAPTSQRMIQHLDGSRDIPPAPPTDRSSRTTRPDLIVIRHVDIEHEFTLFRAKS